jgi:hypothetical protein
MLNPRRRRDPPRRSFTLSGPVVMASCPGPSELRFEDDRRYFAETSKFQSIANAQKGIVLWYEGSSVRLRSGTTIYTKVQHLRIVAASQPASWDTIPVRGVVMQSSRYPDRTVRRNRREPGRWIIMAANISSPWRPRILPSVRGVRRPGCADSISRVWLRQGKRCRAQGRYMGAMPDMSGGAACPGRQGGIIGCVPRWASRIENSRMFGAVSRSQRYCTS